MLFVKLIMKIVISPSIHQKWKEELHKLAENTNQLDEDTIELSHQIVKKYISQNSVYKNELLYGKGYLEFINVPIDDKICPPPHNASRPYNKGLISELSLTGITKFCGLNPFGYKEEKNGAIVHEITPISTLNNESISSEGFIEFDFHTDGAYLSRSIRPHSLSLICLEDEKRTGTNLISIDDTLKKLDKKTISILLESRYQHITPETFKVKNDKNITSILDKIDGVFEIKVALHSVKALDLESEKALTEFKSITKNNYITKNWSSGDLLIFNNLRCMHGRGEIRGKRWLQRCYGTNIFKPATILNLNT